MTPQHDGPDDYPAALRALGTTAMPSPSLEDRVVHSLRRSGRLRPEGRPAWKTMGYWGGLIAASLLAFLVGRATPSAQVTGPRWMLLLFEDERFVPPPADRPGAYVEEYGQWAGQLGPAFVDGAELGVSGGVVDQPMGALVAVENPAPGLGRLTGYFVVAAPSLEAALGIARTSPHLAHGGRIAIRPLGGS